MLGAGQRIHPGALVLFEGKGVWTFPHNDGGTGAAAAVRWTNQLRHAGATWVKPFDFAGYTMPEGRVVKDLNDLCATVDLADEQEGVGHD